MLMFRIMCRLMTIASYEPKHSKGGQHLAREKIASYPGSLIISSPAIIREPGYEAREKRACEALIQ